MARIPDIASVSATARGFLIRSVMELLTLSVMVHPHRKDMDIVMAHQQTGVMAPTVVQTGAMVQIME